MAFTITGCVSTSAFVSLLGISMRITSSAIELEIIAIAVWSKKYSSVTMKKEKKHDKILLLAKSKLSST